MKLSKKMIAVLATTACFATSASAELITNGGFETGDLNGWTTGNFVTTNFDGYVTSGNYSLYMGCVGDLCSTSQTIATTAGASYTFSFDYGSDGAQPNEFIARFGGVDVFHTVNDPTNTRPGFMHESFTVLASSTSTLVEFLGRNDPAYQALDNVSVVPAASVVPEPGALALLLAGLAGLGLSKRRKT